MMKTLLIFVLVAAFVYVQTEETEETETEPNNEDSDKGDRKYSRFLHRFRKRFYNNNLIKNSCENHTDELEASDKVLEKCINEIGNDHTLCESVETYLLNCTSPVVEVIKKCFPPQSKSLPDLGLNAVASGLNYWCKQRGEAIFEIFNPCIWNQFFRRQNKDLRECLDRFNELTAEYNKEYPSSDRVCSDFGDVRDCMKLFIQRDCNSVKTQNAIGGFFDAVLEPCKK